MMKKTETFYSRDTDRSLTSDCLMVAKMTAGALHDKGTEDVGLVAGMLELWVIRADDKDLDEPAYRYYALDTIRDNFQHRFATDVWIVAGHAVPEHMMIDILDWTYAMEWQWLRPTDEAG